MRAIRRKLQFAGNSSYVLTLPKSWIVGKGLDNQKDKSEVLIEEVQGYLRISPADTEEKRVDTRHTIVIDDKDPEEVVRLILAAYLASKSQITIKTSDKSAIRTDIIFSINKTVNKLWGSEIVSESPAEIVIKDALDPASMGLEDIIKRSWFTASNMLDHALTGLFQKDEHAVDRVRNFEDTLDRLYYLALRQLYKASSNSIFANDIGIQPSEIIDYHLLLKNIERIGDHAYQIIQNIDKSSDFENRDSLQEIAAMAQEACSNVIDAFQESSAPPENVPPPKINAWEENLITKVQISINQKEEVNRRAEEIEFVESEFGLSRSLLRITDYASDIGELVLNRLVAQERE